MRDVRSVREQPTATERSDKRWASSFQQHKLEKQQGDVKRAGVKARTSEHDRAFIMINNYAEL